MRFGGSAKPIAFSAPHPFAAFGHCLVGQADDGEGWQPRPDLHLHIDGTRLDTLEGDGGNPGKHR